MSFRPLHLQKRKLKNRSSFTSIPPDVLLTFFESVSRADLDEVERLYKKYGTKLLDTKSDATGESALHLATKLPREDALKLTKFLCDSGANTLSSDMSGWTPVITACLNPNVEVIETLLEHMDTCSSVSVDGAVVLHYLVRIELDSEEKIDRYLNCLDLILSKEVDVDVANQNGCTPLSLATQYGQPSFAEALLVRGASPHSTNRFGQSPLHLALALAHTRRERCIDLIRLLMDYGADPCVERDSSSSTGKKHDSNDAMPRLESPLSMAQKDPSLADLVPLLSKRNPSSSPTPPSAKKNDSSTTTTTTTTTTTMDIGALRGVRKGDALALDPELAAAVAQARSLNQQRNGKPMARIGGAKSPPVLVHSPTEAAIPKSHKHRRTRSHRGPRREVTKPKKSPKQGTRRHHHHDTEKFHHASPSSPRKTSSGDGGTARPNVPELTLSSGDASESIAAPIVPLSMASPRVSASLPAMSSPRVTPSDGDKYARTLISSIESGKWDEVESLMNQPTINVNYLGPSKWGVLHAACSSAPLDVIQKLLDFPDIDPKILTVDGATPLHYLVRKDPSEFSDTQQFYDLITRFIDCGIDINFPNKNGETALHAAAWKNRILLITKMASRPDWKVDFNATMKSRRNNGETALHIAVKIGSVGLVKVLLNAGCDVTLSGDNGTVAELANAVGNTEIIEVLENFEDPDAIYSEDTEENRRIRDDRVASRISNCSCSSGAALDLSRMALSQFPEEVFTLGKHLRRLNLSGNQLGRLPDDFGDRLPMVEELRLDRNVLEDLPTSLGRMRRLRVLNLALNCGTLRSELRIQYHLGVYNLLCYLRLLDAGAVPNRAADGGGGMDDTISPTFDEFVCSEEEGGFELVGQECTTEILRLRESIRAKEEALRSELEELEALRIQLDHRKRALDAREMEMDKHHRLPKGDGPMGEKEEEGAHSEEDLDEIEVSGSSVRMKERGDPATPFDGTATLPERRTFIPTYLSNNRLNADAPASGADAHPITQIKAVSQEKKDMPSSHTQTPTMQQSMEEIRTGASMYLCDEG